MTEQSTSDPVARWHQIVQNRDISNIESLLAENVVFHSPVVHTPQKGKPITIQYLSAAFQVFFNDSFRYVREIKSDHDAILEFLVEIDGISVNGVDIMTWNDEGQLTEFKVMLRPLKAVNLIHSKMQALLEQSRQ